jgi:hypothetical protein
MLIFNSGETNKESSSSSSSTADDTRSGKKNELKAYTYASQSLHYFYNKAAAIYSRQKSFPLRQRHPCRVVHPFSIDTHAMFVFIWLKYDYYSTTEYIDVASL